MYAPRSRIAAGAIVAGAALFALTTPGAVSAQDTAEVAQAPAATAVPAVDQARLEVYAAIHTETAEVARRFYAELARTFESQRKAALRAEMDEELGAIREKHGMTPEEYKRVTYLISVDQATRDAFEALVNPEGAPPPA